MCSEVAERWTRKSGISLHPIPLTIIAYTFTLNDQVKKANYSLNIPSDSVNLGPPGLFYFQFRIIHTSWTI